MLDSLPFEWPDGALGAALQLALLAIVGYVTVVWLALVTITARDSARRSRSGAAQGASILLVLLFFVPGYWVYLMLRPRSTLAEAYQQKLTSELLRQELRSHAACPRCKTILRDDFLVCPACRYRV